MGRIGLACHEERAGAVDNCGAAYTVRSIQSTQRRWPGPTAEQPFKSRTEVRQQGGVTVRAAVLTDDESERYFGASLADHGIQVIWLDVDNASDLPLRFLPIVTDPNYFSAPEVERQLRGWWGAGKNASIASVVAQAPMPDVIAQKRTASGFVFTHREGGLKLFEVGFETDKQLLRFRFVLPVGGSSYAIEKVDFGRIYPLGTVEAVDLAALTRKAGPVALLYYQQDGQC